MQTLPIDFSIKAIAISGGSEAAKSLGLTVIETVTKTVQSESDDMAAIGFSLEQTQTTVQETPPEPEVMIEPSFAVVSPNESNLIDQPDLPTPNLLTKLTKLKSGIHLPSFLPHIRLVPSKRWLFISIPVLLLLIITGLTGFYFYFGRVDVSLALIPQRVNQDLDLIITAQDNKDGGTVLAAQKTLSAKATDSTTTSGESVVGDKATGKVTIHNYTNQSLSLKSGTRVADNNLVFLLDASADIASSSTSIQANGDKLTSPGRATISVTAIKIGAEYNLNKGTQLSVADSPKSNVVAINDNDFTGGSSRTVKAVAKADQEKVLGAATDKIKSQIGDQLRQSDPDARYVALGQVRYATKNFDHPIGEEAATLNLDLEGQQDVLVYSYNQILSLVNQKIKDGVGAGLSISDKNFQITLSDPVVGQDKTFTTKAHVEAQLLPTIDQEKLKNIAKAKKIDVLKGLLQNIPGFHSAKLEITPQIPLLSEFIPANINNIRFTISATP